MDDDTRLALYFPARPRRRAHQVDSWRHQMTMTRLAPQPILHPAADAHCTSEWSDRYPTGPHTLRFAGWYQGPNESVMFPGWDCSCGRRNYDAREIAVIPVGASLVADTPEQEQR